MKADNDMNIDMIRESLEDLPNYPPIPGFPIVTYEPGFEKAWLDIHLAADNWNTFDESTFAGQFGTNYSLIRARQRYVQSPESVLVATATAWFDGVRPDSAAPGLIHWLAVHPEYQGKGLSKPLLLSVCRLLRDLGHETVVLRTSILRPVAVNLYLLFGFLPVLKTDAEKRNWDKHF